MNAARLVLAAALLLAVPALAADAAPDRVTKQREYFTDTVLLAQDGKEVRFFEDVLKDQVVVLNFIFTRCRDACPLLTQKLVQAKAELGGALPRGVRFVSISVDPERDGPAQLRAFAEKQGAAVPGWTFLTGKKASIDLVVKKLGQYVEAPEDHSTAFIAGNARTNHWLRMRPDSPPALIAQQLQRLLAEEAPSGSVAAKD
jgi:protein SCO1/2